MGVELFHNDQISLSNSSSPRRHTNLRLRAAAPQNVAKLRRAGGDGFPHSAEKG
jgi:hypothetical protein